MAQTLVQAIRNPSPMRKTTTCTPAVTMALIGRPPSCGPDEVGIGLDPVHQAGDLAVGRCVQAGNQDGGDKKIQRTDCLLSPS